MGIIFTKYEDSANNNIVFDSSKFDYSYDSDSFPDDTVIDFNGILSEHGEVYYFSRQTETVDGSGRVTAVSKIDYRFLGIIQDISIKDRKIHDMGLAVTGNRKLYFKPSYSITSAGVEISYEIKEGDIITDNHIYDTTAGTRGQWRVVKIIRQWLEPSVEVYRTAILQNINLDGSA